MSELQHKLQFFPKSEIETGELALKLAEIAEPKDVIALIGDLGAGKTVFARSFITAMTSDVEVPSPTFTLVQVYEGPMTNVYHFDLFRIGHSDEIFELGLEDAINDGISLIEWPDRMGPYLPNERLEIILSSGEDTNTRNISYCGYGDKWKKKLAKLSVQ